MMKKEEHKKRVRFWKATDGFSFGAQIWKSVNGDGYTSGVEILLGRWTMMIRLRDKTPTPPWTPSEWAEFLEGFFEGHEAPEWAKQVMEAAGIESKSEGEVDNSVFNVVDKPFIQSDASKGSSSGTISDEVDETWTTYAEYVNRSESEK